MGHATLDGGEDGSCNLGLWGGWVKQPWMVGRMGQATLDGGEDGSRVAWRMEAFSRLKLLSLGSNFLERFDSTVHSMRKCSNDSSASLQHGQVMVLLLGV